VTLVTPLRRGLHPHLSTEHGSKRPSSARKLSDLALAADAVGHRLLRSSTRPPATLSGRARREGIVSREAVEGLARVAP
jgi:hypothetical protein